MIRALWHRKYRPGDWVVFLMSKHGTRPGPRAQHVAPSRHGEEYSYQVEKYWVVEEVSDNQIVVRTRRGKRRTIDLKDHRLRHANLWERWFMRHRFPSLDDLAPHERSSLDASNRNSSDHTVAQH